MLGSRTGRSVRRKKGKEDTDAMQEKSGSRKTPFRMQKTSRNSTRFVIVKLKGKPNTSGDAEERKRTIQNASRYAEEERSTIRDTSRYAEKERNAIRNTSRYAEKEEEKKGSQCCKNPKTLVAPAHAMQKTGRDVEKNNGKDHEQRRS